MTPTPTPTKNAPQWNWERKEIPVRQVLTVPSVRTIVVQVAANENDAGGISFDVDVLPVVAIRSRIYDRYDSRSPNGLERDRPIREDNPGEWTKLGWRHTRDQDVEPIMFNCEFFVDMNGLECTNTSEQIVQCPWPAREDRIRLARIINQLCMSARETVERKAKREAKP